MSTITKIVFPKEPEFEVTDLAQWATWTSNCGTYRITRSVSLLSEGDSYFAVTYGKRILARPKSLPAAFRALAKFHEEDAGEQIETNEESVVKHARSLGLDVLPTVNSIPTQKEKPMGKPMEVARKEAIALFHELRYNTCDSWSNEDIGHYLKMLKEMPYQTFLDKLAGKELTKDQEDFIKDNPIVKDPANIVLLDKVLNGDHKGEFIVFSEPNLQVPEKMQTQEDEWAAGENEEAGVEQEVSTNGVHEEEPKKKRGRPKGSKNGKPKEKTAAKAGTSIADKINLVLSENPKTMAQILKEAKIENQQYGHLRKLCEDGLAKKTDDGYFLTKKGCHRFGR